jgi:AraC-like DNA-binding protein
MLVTRTPRPALRPFVKLMWAAEPEPGVAADPPPLEHVLPTGDMHLAFRLSGPPLRLLGDRAYATTLGHAVVGGARSSHYVREVVASRSVGVQLQPGAAWPLFGASASALAETHTPLELLWGPDAERALVQLHAAGNAEERLDLMETLLAERLPQVHGLHPAVAQGLRDLHAGASVQDAVRHSGYSHRRFIELFRDTTGLAPKLYSRVLRFQGVLRRLPAATDVAQLACESGYSDQAHFQRDFRAFAGLTPQAWRRSAPEHSHHVRVR